MEMYPEYIGESYIGQRRLIFQIVTADYLLQMVYDATGSLREHGSKSLMAAGLSRKSKLYCTGMGARSTKCRS
jgi:hypothetical protein